MPVAKFAAPDVSRSCAYLSRSAKPRRFSLSLCASQSAAAPFDLHVQARGLTVVDVKPVHAEVLAPVGGASGNNERQGDEATAVVGPAGEDRPGTQIGFFHNARARGPARAHGEGPGQQSAVAPQGRGAGGDEILDRGGQFLTDLSGRSSQGLFQAARRRHEIDGDGIGRSLGPLEKYGRSPRFNQAGGDFRHFEMGIDLCSDPD
jgi:hypothetical protein